MKRHIIWLSSLFLIAIGCTNTPAASPFPSTSPSATEPLPTATNITANSETQLKIATWNIEHLRANDNEGDVRRTEEDYGRLAKYAQQLDADIIALQEVDGTAAAARVFSPDEYDFYFSSRRNPQLTGFAVRNNLDVTQNPDFVELGLDGSLRYGTDISLNQNGEEIRFLSIHLKSFCFDNPLDTNDSDCRKLNEQVGVLEEWIDARAEEGTPFVVLGDFNRRFDAPQDDFWPEIDDSEPANADLTRVTEGKRSECWNGRYPEYIDHIVLDKLATEWQVEDSFAQLLFAAEDNRYEDLLSDHCPISIELNITP